MDLVLALEHRESRGTNPTDSDTDMGEKRSATGTSAPLALSAFDVTTHADDEVASSIQKPVRTCLRDLYMSTCADLPCVFQQSRTE